MKLADLEPVLALAERASTLISSVYAEPFEVAYKGTDDPVTRADQQANDLICDGLTEAFPGVPIVSEESPGSFANAHGASCAWFVDPLDGTREFVARNGEFCVMIGFAEGGSAAGGVVVFPALGIRVVATVDEGAFEVGRDGTRRKLCVEPWGSLSKTRVVVSRSRPPSDLEDLLGSLGGASVLRRGSSGLKAYLVASGQADLFVQTGPAGKRWDVCAPEAIVRGAGGIFTTARGEPFEYDSGDLENDRGILASGLPLHQVVRAVFRV